MLLLGNVDKLLNLIGYLGVHGQLTHSKPIF